MSEYRLKTGKVGETFTQAAKKIEKEFADTFLEKDEDNPTGYSLKTGKIGEKATAAYKKIEDTFVGGYKKIEDGFVETFLEKVDEEPPEEDMAGDGEKESAK